MQASWQAGLCCEACNPGSKGEATWKPAPCNAKHRAGAHACGARGRRQRQSRRVVNCVCAASTNALSMHGALPSDTHLSDPVRDAGSACRATKDAGIARSIVRQACKPSVEARAPMGGGNAAPPHFRHLTTGQAAPIPLAPLPSHSLLSVSSLQDSILPAGVCVGGCLVQGWSRSRSRAGGGEFPCAAAKPVRCARVLQVLELAAGVRRAVVGMRRFVNGLETTSARGLSLRTPRRRVPAHPPTPTHPERPGDEAWTRRHD